MKWLFDLLPIVLFFGTFKTAEARPEEAAQWASQWLGWMVSGGLVGRTEAPVLLATAVVIVATAAQVAWLLARGRKVDTMLWVSLALVVVLGGLTVYFHNETFIKWKPSALYWAMGTAFWISPLMFGRNLVQMMLGQQIQAPARVWHRLNFAWVAFFGFMGLLNLWVAYHFTTSVWVNFKLFGGVGLMLVFVLAQAVYLSRHAQDTSATPAETKIP